MDRKNHFGASLIKENPLLTMLLGICPALAVTTGAVPALRFGLAELALLLVTEILVSGIKRIVPDQVRIICYVMISCTLALLLGTILDAYLPSWGRQLENYIPMLALSSLILGRAEMFAGKRTIVDSAVDALGMGLGYLLILLLAGIIREILGCGTFFGIPLPLRFFIPLAIFTLAPGGLFVFGILAAVCRKLSSLSRIEHGEEEGGVR